MVKKKWYRNEIIRVLGERDKPMSTHEIWTHLNEKYKHGVSMQCVSNLLAKNKYTENISAKCRTPEYKSNQITYWVKKDE